MSALSLLPVAFAACEREQALGVEREPAGYVVQVEPVYGASVGPAVEKLAAARCDLEERCGHVGAGKDYASRDACVSHFRSEHSEELNAWRCQGAIVEDELSECLTEIRNNNCGAPLDSLGRILACRSSDLCDVYAP